MAIYDMRDLARFIVAPAQLGFFEVFHEVLRNITVVCSAHLVSDLTGGEDDVLCQLNMQCVHP